MVDRWLAPRAGHDLLTIVDMSSMSELGQSIATLLDRVGLKAGDTVLVHSGISPLNRLVGGGNLDLKQTLGALHEGLRQAIGGDNGTLVAPAFYYDYARYGRPFVVESSPPDRSLGFYPLYLFKQPGIRRSLNPIASLMALGRHAETVCRHDSAYGFGEASPWARLVELDGYSLSIAAPFLLTFVHHVEALIGVPHIYNKIYHHPVRVNGRPVDLPVVAAVRYLKYSIAYSTARISADLEREGLINTVVENGVNVQLMRLAPIQDWLFAKLRFDPFYLLEQPPVFVAGEPPDDGGTGAMRR